MTSRTRRRALVATTSTALLAISALTFALGACSDDPARASFADDAAPDAYANLPEAATAHDAAVVEPDAKPPFDPRDEAVACTTTPCAVQVVAGASHFCARMSDGTVRCWGQNTAGALGAVAPPDGGAADGGDAGKNDAGDAGGSLPTALGLTGVTQLSAAGTTTCALLADGRVFCWGGNGHGELGLAVTPPARDDDRHPIPSQVALPGPAARVDVGQHSACALLATGKVACWGGDEQWQLARPDGGAEPEYDVVRGPGLAALDPLAVARTSTSTLTSFALTTTGEVWSWGALAGKEGIVAGRVSSVSPEPLPKRLLALANVTSLASSPWILPPPVDPPLGDFPPPTPDPVPHAHACALAGGDVYCWGRSERGALCTGLPDAEVSPKRVPLKSSKAWPQQLSIAEELTCARLTDGTVQCCGGDEHGRLGTGAVGLYSAFFTPAAGFAGHAVAVAAGDSAVCVLVQGGTVECWGSNAHGELGGAAVDALPHPSSSKVTF